MGIGLGGPALIDPDEGRSATVALAMAESGDFLVPRLNGIPHFDKPILFHVAQAAAMLVLGRTETAARLPSLLAAWATVGLTWWFARRLFDDQVAWVAAVAMATAPLAMAMARTAIFDSQLALFVALALMAFHLAVEEEDVEGRASTHGRWTMLAWAAMGLGALTKGPVALLVPLLVAAPHAVWRHRSRRVWHPAGPVLLLLLVVPWLVVVERQVPGFLRYALVTETWQRLTTDEMQRGGPLWYFLPYLVAGVFPWIVVAAATAFDARPRLEERAPVVYLLAWLALPLVFFSLSQSKRPQYILPLLPAVAILAAWGWCRTRNPARAGRAAAAGWALCGTAFTIAAWVAAPQSFAGDATLAASARTTGAVLGALMIGAGALAWTVAGRRTLAAAALSLPLALLPVATAPLFARVAAARSGKAMAAALRSRLGGEATVVGIECFSPSLSFYLDRPTHLSSARGQPLASNFILRTHDAWIDRPGSVLHGPGWWREQLEACPSPLVFLLESHHEAQRWELALAGLPVLHADRKLLAMGPCRPSSNTRKEAR